MRLGVLCLVRRILVSRWLLLWLICFGAKPSWALTEDEAWHLLLRTGFAPSAEQVKPLLMMSRSDAVRQVLECVGKAQTTSLPKALLSDKPFQADMSRTERRRRRALGRQLKAWWLQQMWHTQCPMQERVLLLLHDHFPSALQKVKYPRLLLRQHQLFRRHGLGDFRQLVVAISQDAAMLRYLDGARVSAEIPNENYARELLELFTLGEGHFSESDVRSAAPVLSLWRWQAESGTMVALKNQAPTKTRFLGRTAYWQAHSLIERIFQQPQAGRPFVENAWLTFMSPSLDSKAIDSLLEVFQQSDFSMAALFEALLNRPEFWHPDNRGALIKPPVVFLLAGTKHFQSSTPHWRELLLQARLLGQDLFDPPSVKGWPRGLAWINDKWLHERQEIQRHWLRQAKPQWTKTTLSPLPARQPRGRYPSDEWLQSRVMDLTYQLY